MKIIGSILFMLILCLSSYAQNNRHDIKIQLENNDNDTLYLAYFYGDNQYVADTAIRNSENIYQFSGDRVLKHGVYIFVLPPQNEFFQILIEDSQSMEIKADAKDLTNTVKITGSPINASFYEYIQYLEKARVEKQSILDSLASQPEDQRSSLEEKVVDIDRDVLKKQDGIITQYKGSLLDIMLSSNRDPIIPEFKDLTKEEQQRQSFNYYHAHYFDNISLENDVILRTPFIHNKVMTYIDKYTIQTPDSIIAGIDQVLKLIPEDHDLYRFLLIKFLNKYANSKVIGQDAIYVHLAKEYYGKNKAPWIEEETLLKILDNAERFSYTLIGNDAPPLTLFDMYAQKDFALADLKGQQVVIIFWSPTCAHCEKSMPTLPAIVDKYKDDNVKFISICTKADDSCKTFTDEKVDDDRIIRSVPVSSYGKLYDVRTTPKIFMIDAEGKIASKGMAFNQIEEVMDILLKAEANK